MTATLQPYDALLLISFGGPESPEEVMPFLLRVTAGRGVPQARLEQVAERYLARGGVSPINDETRALADALRAELTSRGLDLPLEIGNRNSPPFLSQALDKLAAGGARRVLSLTTSAYPSYPSCRQYLENVADALTEVPVDMEVDGIRHYAHHPGFVAANVAAVTQAVRELGRAQQHSPTHLVFVTHSLPVELAETSGPPPWESPGSYVDWHLTLAHNVSDKVSLAVGRDLPWSLAYCSRSGAPHQPWLEPDIKDHLTDLADRGTSQVVLAPIGFTSDHMEVVWDLDEEAVPHAESLGLRVRRASTARTHPEFVAGLVDLMLERSAVARGEQVLPKVIDHGSPGRHACPGNCCPHPTRRGAPTA
ncbi:ferrochelatase [Granulicoccus sp. GXG6511]|uniref:ferrochelatase n=1 Tax=Granulicoccus sp. GXG6511 TaxID=3381351 RepID=UPI003D7EF08F